MWQVNFAPEKTQAMVISRSPVASQAVSGLVCFVGKFLTLKGAHQDPGNDPGLLPLF